MHPPWKTELRALSKLALPVITVQVGMMLMGFVDTAMVGHYDERHLAAAALGNFYSFVVIMFGIGVLHSLDPVMSQAVGAGEDWRVSLDLQRGVVLAGITMPPICALYLLADPVLRACGQEPELVPLARSYIWILIPSILPFLLFQILRSTLQAYHRTAAVVWTILIANVVNVGLNWWLIFGGLGLDPMGVEGSAVATTISRWVMFAGLLGLGRARVWHHVSCWSRRAVELRPLIRLVRVGAPIGLQMVLEFGAFGTTLLLMGWISVSAVAGHQVAITLAAFTYMFPVGLAAATSVRVGNAVGRGDASGARWSALLALLLATVLMGGFGLLFLAIPGPLASMFSDDTDIGARRVAMLLLPIAAVFQVMDGLQVVCLGILRGVADTKVPMVINLLGFWVLGIPTGYWLAFGPGEPRPQGLWWGLTVGLGAVAVFLLLRVRYRLRGELVRTNTSDE